MNTSNRIEDNENEKFEEFLKLLETNPEAIESQVINNEYKELLKIAFEEAKSSWRSAARVVPALLKLNVLEKSEIKEQYKELLKIAFEKAESDLEWAEYAVLALLELNILEKGEIKEQYKGLLKIVFEKAKSDFNWAERVVPALLKLNILEESEIENSEIKEQYKELLQIAFKNAKSNDSWAVYVPKLLKLNILKKSEIQNSEIKEQYKELLKTAFKNAKSDYGWTKSVRKLLELNILEKSEIEKSEIKDQYKELLKTVFKKAKSSWDWTQDAVPALLELNILEKSEIEKSEIEKSEIEKSEIKDQYKELSQIAFEKAKTNSDWLGYAVPALLKLNILEKSEIKDQYKELLGLAFEKAKSDCTWADSVIPELLKLDILEKSEIKKQYKELLGLAFEKAKSDFEWADFVLALLKLNMLENSEIKEQYKELLGLAFEKAKSNHFWAALIPELLKLNILDESEINIDIILPQNITLTGTTFLEKNRDKIDTRDIEFIDQMDDSFSKKEFVYIYRQDYDFFKKVESIIKENNLQKIWKVKKEIYQKEEIQKLKALEDYFGEGVWTYFVDKIPGNKTIKNRFRDPHNALLHANKIIELAKQLESKGITKEEFIKNYLGVAGDRNNGYQQLNNFLERYKSDRKELVESELGNENGLKNNSEFIEYVNNLIGKEKSGELYKNLDEFENVLTVLNMVNQKQSLIKLQKLADSDNSQDKVLYEYYKGAIYHPRTKPIIMEMYEDPGEFLGLDDTTFRDLNKIHQAKKPSNMVENFEFLDFDAKDLVNCLPLGVYDKLSYFKPFEMRFYINGSDVYTKDEIQQKIGEFLNGADQKKISVIITKLKEQGDVTMWFKEWKANKDEFIINLLGKYGVEKLVNMFVGLGYSEFNKYRDLREMTAKISPKSDSNNWFNGFNCDSLAEGQGKKVVAMFNPYCTDFCIYEGEQDPKEDNLKVTSWVTLNRAIPENFTTLLGKVKSETTHDIVSVLGDKFEDYKDPSEYVITMDNIEAKPNFGRKNELAVRKMYEKFFSEYVRQNPISPNGIPINTHKFYSGVNYNKLDILTDRVPNESLPVFVNAYSDNSESYSLQGNLSAGEQKEKEKKIGIHPLSIEDVVQISYMEGKIYPSSMKDHLGNLQHEITASILNNTLKGRPNLSFARYNEEGKIGGYILAYQGKMEDGTPGVYISDFAIDEKERGTAGIKMIHHWMKEVKEKYPNMLVFTRARENTSYRMIKAFAEKQGYKILQDEIMEDGGENFHLVLLNP